MAMLKTWATSLKKRTRYLDVLGRNGGERGSNLSKERSSVLADNGTMWSEIVPGEQKSGGALQAAPRRQRLCSSLFRV